MGLIQSLMQGLHEPVYQSRLRELVRRIVPHLRDGDRVLDVGCGFGGLGRAIMAAPSCPPGVTVSGLERFPRDTPVIEVDPYDGVSMPYTDGAYEVVILADVLHHEEQPHRLLRESRRVASRLVVIKDHCLAGPFAQSRVALIDWAANAPFSVRCLYRYNTLEQWRRWHEQHALHVETELTSMQLYPPLVNFLFGRRLQYLAVTRVEERTDGEAGASDPTAC